MKTFKEFVEDFKNDEFSMTYNDKLIAYAAYCQGYIEGVEREHRIPGVIPVRPFDPAPKEAIRITCNSETK